MDEAELRIFLEENVRHGKTNAVILAYLKQNYDIDIKLRTLKSYLTKFGIKRNDQTISPIVIAGAIDEEGRGAGLNAGYRLMHKALRNRHRLNVSREVVRNILARWRGRSFAAARAFPWQRCMRYCPGPNFRWSEDGHDKLGKYNIYIHACVDEYSRRIMWLHAYVNNRQSDIVASYYVNAVKKFGVVPHKVVSDFGRESTIIAQCQALFYSSDRNPGAHHTWTYSVRNVTVESWWRRLRQMCTLYWHGEFEQLESEGLWCGDIVDRWALVSVYLPLINNDLERTAFDHNMHTIRSQRGRIRPGGQPNDLYNLPERFGGRRCGREVSTQEIDLVRNTFNLSDINSYHATPPDVEAIVNDFFLRNRVEITRDNAKTLYMQIRRLLSDICS